MKNLVISAIILFTIIAIILSYGIFSKITTDKLSAFSESEKAFSIEAADAAYAYWLSRRDFIQIGVNTSITDSITLSFLSLHSALETSDTEEILRYAEDLRFYIKELAEVNCVSLENII